MLSMSLALSYIAYNGASLTGWMLYNELPTCTPLSTARFLPSEHSYDFDSDLLHKFWSIAPADSLSTSSQRQRLQGWSADNGTSPVLTQVYNTVRKKWFSSWSVTMASTKVTTVIVNRTGEALVLEVGNQNCFPKVATVEVGGEHKVEIDVNWTYREFSLQPVGAGLLTRIVGSSVLKKVVVSSDDCCDFGRIIVSESGGKFHVEKIARRHFDTSLPVNNNWRALFWSKIKRGFWQ